MKIAVTSTILLEAPDQPIDLVASTLRRANEVMIGRPMQTVTGQVYTVLGIDRFEVVEVPVVRSSFTCPRCGRTSFNPTDIAQRYCGACHRFVDS